MFSAVTNTSAYFVQRSINATSHELEESMQKLASGKRINASRDDAAGTAISSRLNANVRGLTQEIKNAQASQALISVAEGGMSQIEASLQRLREIAVQSSNDTYSDTDRSFFELEKAQIFNDINQIAHGTSWAGQKILDGSFLDKTVFLDQSKEFGTELSFSINKLSVPRIDYTPTKLGEEELINTDMSQDQTSPHTTTLSNGSYVVTWLSNNDVKVQIFHEDGTKLGTEITANTTTSGFQGWGDTAPIAALSNGGFVITYQSPDIDGVGVFGQRFDNDGVKVGTEFQINTTNVGGQSNVSVSSFDTGGFICTWTSPDANGWGVYGQRFDLNGDKLGSEFQINTYELQSQWRSAVTTLENGGFIVAWESDGQDGEGDGVFAQLYNADGSRKGAEFQVNTSTQLDQKEPSVARLNDDSFAIVWNTHDPSTGEDWVMGQIFDTDGNKVFSEFQINTTPSSGFATPQVTATSDQGFLVTWRQNSFNGGVSDGSGYGVFGQRFDKFASRLGTEFQLNTTNIGSQINPSVTLLDNGNILSVWSGPKDETSLGVFNQKFDLSGRISEELDFSGDEINFASSRASLSAMSQIDDLLELLNSERSALGSISNRLDHIISNHTSTVANIAMSLSRIVDTNFADETGRLAKSKILLEASTAMLAQANTSKYGILKLINM